MTLKEKFKPFAMDNHIEKYAEHNAKELEQIADKFAIGFAEWVLDVYIEHKQNYILEELLEIYKKEKELLEIYKKEKVNYDTK
jgi:hypothetical protein